MPRKPCLLSLDAEIIDALRSHSRLSGEAMSRIAERGISLLLDVEPEIAAQTAVAPRQAPLTRVTAEVLDSIRALGPGPHDSGELATASGMRFGTLRRSLAILVRRGDIYRWEKNVNEYVWATETPLAHVEGLIRRWREAGGCPAIDFDGEYILSPSGARLLAEVRRIGSYLSDATEIIGSVASAIGVPADRIT